MSYTDLRLIVAGLVAGLFVLTLPARAAAQASPPSQEAPASVSGTLLDGTGRALASVALTVVDPEKGQKRETKTDEAGRFMVAGLPAGDYQIRVVKPGFEDVAGRVVIAAGQQVQRDVVARIVSLRHHYRVSPKGGTSGSISNAGTPAAAVRTVVLAAAPDDPCKAATSGGCLTPPTRLVEAWPVYPPALAAAGVGGTVEVKARLGTDGFLTDFKPNDGARSELVAVAIEALKVWEYSPLRLNGVPQEGRMTVTFTFEAGKKQARFEQENAR